MVDISLDPVELEAMRSNLALTRSAFFAADLFAETAAGAVGHPKLAEALHDFAGDWDDRREEIVKGIGFLHDAVQGILTGFGTVDHELARGLE